MALGRSGREGAANPGDQTFQPGEPGVGLDLAPPFTAPDPATNWLFGLNRFGIRPGLTRIEGLLADLGHPERRLRTLVVAGTNGKGSTTRILARLLRAAGHRVATYTSPHLLQVTERIEIDESALDAAEFAARVTAIRPLTEKHGASWFETLTALAVTAARDHGVDYLCCETGLGGRLDASNALPSVATLLTTVGRDHQHILGESLSEIAAEKLGLLKRGVPLFTAVEDTLRGQVFTAAVTAGSPCFFADELARWPAGAAGDEAWTLTLRDREISGLPDVGPAAMRRNVALAMLALTELSQARDAQLLPPDPGRALGNLFLPGRYQHVLRDPIWIFDTAHNEQALRQALGSFVAGPCAGRRILLWGGMQDKELPDSLAPLFGACDHVIGLPISLPRARTPHELSVALARLGCDPGELVGLADRRCAVARDLAGGLGLVAGGLQPADTVLVTGSCFLVAEVLHLLGVRDLVETRSVRDAAPVLARVVAGPETTGKDAL